MGWRSSVVTCVSMLIAACAASPPHWTPAQDVSADEAVVYVSSDCTAVLVGEQTALTAAHCVDEPGALHVQVGRRRIPVRDCVVHPDAYRSPRGCGAGPGETALAHDLAVLTLAEPTDVHPVPVLLTAPLARSWWSERTVRLVGWDRRPRFVGPLERRSGENQIVQMHPHTFVTEPVGRAGFTTIIGDSGGPALLRVDGAERVVGVLRGGPAPGSRRSVYAPTFEPGNARWLLSVLPEEFARDIVIDEELPFGRPHPLGVNGDVRPMRCGGVLQY